MEALKALIAQWEGVRPAAGFDEGYLAGLYAALEILEDEAHNG